MLTFRVFGCDACSAAFGIGEEIAFLRVQCNIFASLQLLRPCAKIICTDLPGPEFVKGMADILSESSG